MGCPVKKIVKTGAGSSLLLHPDRIYDCVAAVVDAVDLPVTVKMRIGWDDDHINAVENAQAAEKAGASMVAMHGRTREQMYSGRANWQVLSEVAQSIDIPFYGNGDVRTPEQARYALDHYGADGVMVGRGCLGDPWLIQRMVHYVETGELLPEKKGSEKIEAAIEHLKRLVDLKGEHTGVSEFRGIVSYYLKGIPRSAKVKVACMEKESAQDVIDLLTDFRDQTLEREEEEAENPKPKRRKRREGPIL